ncbi:peptidylprolyl isomerase [Candidatus Berkelbacteria bacterium]|nr:peptidylprolyl isomerase [Candidatus Berkelbacteria bacterium]
MSAFPKWLPWTIAGVASLIVFITIGIGVPFLRGNDAPQLRSLARWLPIPVARVGGQLIWAREYLDYRTFIETFIARSNQAGEAVDPGTPIGRQVIDLLVSNATIKRATKNVNLKVKQVEIDAAYKEILVLQGGEGEPREVSEEELNTILEELYGSSRDRLRDLIEIRLLQDKVKTELLERVHFRHILVTDENQAKELIGKLKNENGDFSALAKEFSQHLESRDNSGDMGWVARGEQLPVIEEAIFSSPAGILENPVKSDFGYHAIEILEKQGVVQQSFDNWLKDAEQKYHAVIYLKT